MRVQELIDILRDQPPDAEVEIAIIAPVADDDDDITVDRYSIDGMLPWHDENEDGDDDGDSDSDSDELVIWLIGGEEDDVEDFLDALEND